MDAKLPSPTSLVERPCPGRSTAITVRFELSAG